MTAASILTLVQPVQRVNRSEQVEELGSAIHRIRLLGSIFQTVLEWYGSPGIGKTTLVEMLGEECVRQGVPYALVDFNPGRNPEADRHQADRTVLVNEMMQALEGTAAPAAADPAPVYQAITNYRSTPGGDEDERRQLALYHVTRAFVAYANCLMQGDPIVLLFDETERAAPDVAAWLEEWIISPLAQWGRCLIVWSGRRPQRWKRFETRRRLASRELDVFDKQTTAELFQKNSRYPDRTRSLSEQVRRVTRGHPFANMVALRQLDTLIEAGEAPDVGRFPDYERDLLDGLVQNFVDAYAFKDVPMELADACRMLALLRQFDVILLREMLTHFVPSFAHYQGAEFGELLTRLRETQLVIWDDKRKGYALDPTLRSVLTEHIWRHQPRLFADVNHLALEVYRDWIQRAGDNRGVYIVEELYHQACLNRVPDQLAPAEYRELGNVLEEQLREYPQPDLALRASALERLEHELEGDLELTALIGQNISDRLVTLVRRAMAGARSELSASATGESS
jgi:hypothetical protein